MNRKTLDPKLNLISKNSQILKLFILLIFSSSLLALSSQKENKEYKDNLLLSITESINTIHNKLGNDIIFDSGFEAVPILSLSANPFSINFGGSITLSWNIGNTPTQCVKSGDWPINGNMSPQDITNGPHNLVINNIDSNKTYSLICTNKYGSVEKEASVTIENGNAWPSCSGESAAILNGNEDRSILAQGPGFQPTNYNGYYTNIYNNSGSGTPTPWPGTLGANLSLNLEKGHYIAAQFTTSNESIDGKFLTQSPSNYQGVPAQAYTVSISECPGDFNVHLDQPACKFSFETFRWSTTPNPPGPPGFFCELEKNKTYYLNIVHSNNGSQDNYETSDCLSQTNSCGHLSSQNLVIIR